MKALTKALSCASIAALSATSTVPAFAYFEGDAIPGYVTNVNNGETGRRVTSRAIRANRNQNAPVIGEKRTDEDTRGSTAGSIGEAYKVRPVRGAWRRQGLRGEQRRQISNARGGEYRILNLDGMEETEVRSEDEKHPNWRSWARGRQGPVRNLNGGNRADFE